jgi:hypothetical protein
MKTNSTQMKNIKNMEHINHYTINAAYAFKNVKLDH